MTPPQPAAHAIDWHADGFHTRGWQAGPPPDWDNDHDRAFEATRGSYRG